MIFCLLSLLVFALKCLAYNPSSNKTTFLSTVNPEIVSASTVMYQLWQLWQTLCSCVPVGHIPSSGDCCSTESLQKLHFLHSRISIWKFNYFIENKKDFEIYKLNALTWNANMNTEDMNGLLVLFFKFIFSIRLIPINIPYFDIKWARNGFVTPQSYKF